MTIYNINFNGNHYITDDNDIFLNYKESKLVKSIILGDENDANLKLMELRNQFYNTELSKIYISEVIVDNDTETWVPFDIEKDSIDVNVLYMIQTNIDNERLTVTGESLLTQVNTIKERILNMVNLNTYTIVDSMPIEDLTIKQRIQLLQPTTTGTTNI